MNLFISSGVAFAMLMGVCSLSMAQQFHYEPSIVELSGKLVSENHYGPPNFGETPEIDLKETIAILVLDNPISVLAEPRGGANLDSFAGVSRIQLIGASARNLLALTNQHVTLRGTLFEKENGEHYTDVLMNIVEIIYPKKN